MMRIGTRMATGFDQHFSSLGLTQSQFRILLSVFELGGDQGISPSFLAENLLIERGTASIETNRMVERGWLERVAGQNRRTYRLVLTEKGNDLLQKAIPRAIALADQTISNIPRDQLVQMRSNLEVIEDRLRAFTPVEEV